MSTSSFECKAIEMATNDRALFDALFNRLLCNYGQSQALAMVLFWLADLADDIACKKAE